MIKSEFEKLVKTEVSADDFEVIECVYMYHPAIKNVNGKQMIADLFLNYGFIVIKDMMLRAKIYKAFNWNRRNHEEEQN